MFGQDLAANQNRFQQSLGANAQNYQQALQGSSYANQIRQQQLAEQMQQRGFSLNEINALLSGQQVATPQMPNFSTAQAAQPAPIYQAAVDKGNAAQAGLQNIANLAGGLGSAAIMASDRRLKKNIKPVGTLNGYPAYSYDYIWGEPGMGVMADEVPEEFTIEINGYKFVDYGRLMS